MKIVTLRADHALCLVVAAAWVGGLLAVALSGAPSPTWAIWRLSQATHGNVTDTGALEAAELDIRVAVGPSLRRMFPGYSACQRCGWPWAMVEPHVVTYAYGWGHFALCEWCWERALRSESTETIVGYWMASAGGSAQWPAIEAAVRAEVAGHPLIFPPPHADQDDVPLGRPITISDGGVKTSATWR